MDREAIRMDRLPPLGERRTASSLGIGVDLPIPQNPP
jgi:hypothetical protein